MIGLVEEEKIKRNRKFKTLGYIPINMILNTTPGLIPRVSEKES